MPAERLAGFGTTVFTEMSALAERTGSINLGQGFPDEDGPAEVLDAAAAALAGGYRSPATTAMLEILTDVAANYRTRRPDLQLVAG